MIINGKEIVVGVKTRKIMRQINEELLKGVNISSLGGDVEFPAINADKAEELTIRLLTGLTQDDIDNLSESEYNEIKLVISRQTVFPR